MTEVWPDACASQKKQTMKQEECNNKKRIPTIRDVSAEAKVSTASVSRVFCNDPYVSEGTRERVLEAAKKIGYVPNFSARCLRSNVSGIIGILIPDMVDDFFYHICSAAMNELGEQGYMPVIAFSQEDPEREKRIVQDGLSRKMDGFIMCVCDATRNNEYFKSIIERSKTPIVFFDRVPYNFDAPTVNIDNEAAVFELTEYLIRIGYNKIAYIKNPTHMEYSGMRSDGYRRAMEGHGLLPQFYGCQDITLEAGKAMRETIIEHLNDIEAVIACDDFVAIGLMHELQRMGLNIPNDIAIAGIGGSVLTSTVFPELTTIDYPKEQIGRELAQMLIDIMHGRNIRDKHITVRPIIRYRASTERNY